MTNKKYVVKCSLGDFMRKNIDKDFLNYVSEKMKEYKMEELKKDGYAKEYIYRCINQKQSENIDNTQLCKVYKKVM